MSKKFCFYKDEQYEVDDKICMDGHLAVCMPDGKWDSSPEVCDEAGDIMVLPSHKLQKLMPALI